MTEMIADDYTETEIQTHIIELELEDPIETANNNHYSFFPQTRKDAESYFFGCFISSSSSITSKLQRNILLDKGSHLTQGGKEIAKKMRICGPPIYYWYRRYYAAIEDSQAFAKYNKEVFGIDIDQFGFSSTRQVDKLAELLDLDSTTICLDVGCGNGKLAEYIYSITESPFVCIDYVPEAIYSAQRRCGKIPLKFEIMHIDDIATQETAFDSVMSIDSIFYGESYDVVFSDISKILNHNGILAFITSENRDMEASLGKYFQYDKHDYTEDSFKIMKVKNRVLKKYEADFRSESLGFVWDQYMAESIDDSTKEIPDGFTRIIYRATKRC